MSLSECDKCGEMVDEAKAFCPGCGRAFVDENIRKKSSEFNMLDGTMQLGNTMYNQMLSDMGLNISAAPDKPDAEVAQSAAPAYKPVAQSVQQVLQPAVQKVIQPAVPVETPKQEGSNKWMIIGAIVIIVLIILIIAAIVIGLFLWSRFG